MLMLKKEAFKRFAEKWSKWFNWVAMSGVAVMMFLTVFDIIGAKLKIPIPGCYYITGFILLGVGAFGIAQAEVMGRHIRIDIFLLRLPERIKGAFGVFSNFVSAAIIAVVIVTSFQYGIYLQNLGLVTMDLSIPMYPFALVIALGCVPLFLVLVNEFFESVRKAREK
jgi:TRAP-type C4-dicarboxylate transport system permease small subunit